MNIAYITPYEGEQPLAEAALAEHDVHFYSTPIRDEVPVELREVEVLSVFVDSRVTATMIDSMPNLKVLALRSTGFDHVDVAHAQAKGIVVTSVPHYGSQTVAEYAFSLILALSRKVYATYDTLRTTGVVDVKKFEGFDLAGKTLGVIGTGAIGRRVCRIARGFDMQVVAYDVYPNEQAAEEIGFGCCSYDEVLAQSDIITFHVPATKENKHMLGAEALSKTKRGVHIINTARGELIDTIALLHALKSGQVAGAGLDVFEGEQFIKNEMLMLGAETEFDVRQWQTFVAEHELLQMENVIVTPHMAFNSVEAKREITETNAQNIKKALAGEPDHVVGSS
jgi:D-lactate dehydrogenase